MENQKMKKVMLVIPEELHTQFKAVTVQLKTNMTQLIKKMMVDKVKEMTDQ